MAKSAQNRRRLLVAVVAGILAVGAFAAVVMQLNSARTADAPLAATQPTAKAVVALTDLAAGDQLSSANIAVTEYPTSALPAPGLYYTDTQQLLSSTWYTAVAVPHGQLVLASDVSQQVTPVKLPPISLKDGDVAMSIPYDESKDAGGFIQQDDYIDVLVDDPTSKTVHYAFQGVHVLRVGDRAAQPTGLTAASAAPAVGATLLLIEIPREQAAALAFAIDQGYTIRYVIRPHDQQTQSPLPSSDPVGASNWLNVVAG